MALRGDSLTKGRVFGVLGVDPGVTNGYAFFKATGLALPELLAHGHVESDGQVIAKVLDLVTDCAQRNGITDLRLVCEQQYVQDSRKMDKGKRMGMQRAALSVATSKGRWLGLCEDRGFVTGVEVHPTTWREAQLGKGWGRKPRKQCKAQAVVVANALWKVGLPKSQDHTAEAMLIGAYYAKELFITDRRSAG